MRHDIPNAGTMSEANPHLIFHNFTTPLGERVQSILKYLFPVPKDDATRVITFANDADHISFRCVTPAAGRIWVSFRKKMYGGFFAHG